MAAKKSLDIFCLLIGKLYRYQVTKLLAIFQQSQVTLQHLYLLWGLPAVFLLGLIYYLSKEATALVKYYEEEVQEGEDEHHTKDGDKAVYWLTPVKYGVDVRLVSYVGATTLNIGKVREDIKQAEYLHMVGMQAPPRSGRYEDIQDIDSSDQAVTGQVLEVQWFLIIEEWPVDYRAESRHHTVHICQHPQGAVAPWERRAGRLITRGQRYLHLAIQLSSPPVSDQDPLPAVGKDSQEPPPVSKEQEIFPGFKMKSTDDE